MIRYRHVACLVLVLTVGLLGWGANTGMASALPKTQAFVSRPDLHPPVIDLETARPGSAAGGYIFVATKGTGTQPSALILNSAGQLVWMDPALSNVSDFGVQEYQGQPVLTYWKGAHTKSGHGIGDYYLLNDHYQLIATVKAGAGLAGDLHEFRLTPSGAALFTAYTEVPANLTSIGGPAAGYVLDGYAQEVDVATGRVLFEWDALSHVPLTDSYATLKENGNGTKADPYDYFHINSIDQDSAGHILISARNTHAIYQVDPATGQIQWRLGGKRSSFAMEPDASFAWQHDAEYQPDGVISLFDDEGPSQDPPYARALLLSLDTANMTARVEHQYPSPDKLVVGSQGSTEVLPDGDVFVGWGADPYYTEFTRSGTVVLDASFGAGASSYRAFRFPWTGIPLTAPTVAARPVSGGGTSVWMSWNGANQVVSWRVFTGSSAESLVARTTVRKSGFETTARVPASPYVQVEALGPGGQVLGTSPAVHTQ